MDAKVLQVSVGDRLVGTMAETKDHLFAFQYDREWIENGFSLNPFSLPLEDRLFLPTKRLFQGLWGIFSDSLPDAWGRLLVDRMLKSKNIDLNTITQLDRLAIVGSSGMGAMTYMPAWDVQNDAAISDLDELALSCQRILQHEEITNLDELFQMGGSSGGARPKVMTPEWIIKFPASGDQADVGLMEKAYMDCAADCGIHVPETKLMPSEKCAGYFASKRFDRIIQPDGTFHRIHMATVAALLEMDWRTPTLDYHTLMKLTKILCRNCPEDIQQMYRRACFNVFAHNRDDHAKNFSFMYDREKEQWHVSPAYDLTWSTTYFGEHTTTVDGNGADPGKKELIAVGRKAGLSEKVSSRIAGEIFEKTRDLVARFDGIYL